MAIERMKKDGDVDGLIGTLKAEASMTNLGDRSSAAIALGEIGDVRAIAPLVQALKGWDGVLRHFAAGALEKLGWRPRNVEEEVSYFIAKQWYGRLDGVGPAAAEILLHFLKDPDEVVKCTATRNLARLKDERAIEPFIEMQGKKWNSYPRAQSIAAAGLVAMGPPILERLRQALRIAEEEQMKTGDLPDAKSTRIEGIIETIEKEWMKGAQRPLENERRGVR